MNFFTPETIIYSIMMFVILYMINKTYKTDLVKRNYLIMVYLYISFALFSIILGGKLLNSFTNFSSEKMSLFIIAYLIISFLAMFLISSDNLKLAHLGLGLFILMQSILISLPLQYSTNVNEALLITAIIFAILTMTVFYSSDQMVLDMANWAPTLLSALSLIVISELLFLFFADKETVFKYNKYFNWLVIMVMSFFILSDTSVKVLKAKIFDSMELTHLNMNYPKESVNLSLNFLNIFYRLINMEKR